MENKRALGAGGAHQRLEAHARLLERRGEKPAVVEAIRVMLAWRSKILTEKYGPSRDFSQ